MAIKIFVLFHAVFYLFASCSEHKSEKTSIQPTKSKTQFELLLREAALTYPKPGKTFHITVSSDRFDERAITVLDSIVVKHRYLIPIYEEFIFGNDTPHGSSCLYFYNGKDELAAYDLQSSASPVVRGGKLLFDSMFLDCYDSNIIDFTNGLPRSFRIGCRKFPKDSAECFLIRIDSSKLKTLGLL